MTSLSSESPPRGAITGEPLDLGRVNTAARLIRAIIDEDHPDTAHLRLQAIWAKLTNDERLAIQSELNDKAVDSRRMYKTLLKDYLRV